MQYTTPQPSFLVEAPEPGASARAPRTMSRGAEPRIMSRQVPVTTLPEAPSQQNFREDALKLNFSDELSRLAEENKRLQDEIRRIKTPVQVQSGAVKAGQSVTLADNILYEARVPLTKGLTGVVHGIDADGDAEIAFEGMSQRQWVLKKDFHKFLKAAAPKERYVNVPQIQPIERIVPVPEVTYVDRDVYEDRVVPVPAVMYEERVVEVPVPQIQEVIHHRQMPEPPMMLPAIHVYDDVPPGVMPYGMPPGRNSLGPQYGMDPRMGPGMGPDMRYGMPSGRAYSDDEGPRPGFFDRVLDYVMDAIDGEPDPRAQFGGPRPFIGNSRSSPSMPMATNMNAAYEWPQQPQHANGRVMIPVNEPVLDGFRSAAIAPRENSWQVPVGYNVLPGERVVPVGYVNDTPRGSAMKERALGGYSNVQNPVLSYTSRPQTNGASFDPAPAYAGMPGGYVAQQQAAYPWRPNSDPSQAVDLSQGSNYAAYASSQPMNGTSSVGIPIDPNRIQRAGFAESYAVAQPTSYSVGQPASYGLDSSSYTGYAVGASPNVAGTKLLGAW